MLGNFRLWVPSKKTMLYAKRNDEDTLILKLELDGSDSWRVFVEDIRWQKFESFTERTATILFDSGVKDKTGRHIYDGDVVLVDGLVATVFYSERFGGFEVQATGNSIGFYRDIEVLGNIYENPTLV